MSNSDWIKHIAVGLTAIAVTFIWAAFYVGSQIGESRGESNKHTTEYERHAEEQIRATCLSGQTGDIAECVSKVIKATNEDRRAQSDLVAQTEMARWAFYMLIATIGVAVITGAGVYYVWQTLKVTRDIGQAQARAYLDAVKFEILPVKLGDDLIFYGMVHLKNSGQSPANDVLVRVSTSNAPHDQFKKLGRIGAGVTEIAKMQLPYVSHEEGGELILGADVTLSYDTVFSDIGRIEDAHSAPFSARFHPKDRVTQKMIALGSRVLVVG